MATRTITGRVYDENGKAWASQSVVFNLQTDYATTSGETVLNKTYTETTDASGDFSADLAVPDSDAWQYRCSLPDGSSFIFNLEAGAATTLRAILADMNLTGTVSASALTALIDIHAADTTTHGTTGDIVGASGAVDNDYAKFTAATELEGRSYAEVRTDLNVEDGADVTDATNVAAAGATMDTDADVSGNTWVIDEDNLVSDLDTKVPTQQSVKSYADAITAADVDAVPEDANFLSKSANYELAAGDKAKIIHCTGTFTITAPDGLDSGFQVAINNIGTGTITLAAATTLNSKDAAVTLPNQYGMATLYHGGSNVWYASGDLE